MNFSNEFWVNLIAYFATGIGAVITVTWKISTLATKDELREKVKERNNQIDRVYERFDEFKKTASNDFVRKDMCGQLHATNKDELKRIDQEYKDFRHDIRNTVQKIYDEIGFQNKKIDELKELILKK